MKNLSIRSFAIGLIILASICSYTYINTVTVTTTTTKNHLMQEVQDTSDQQSEELTLPDVRLVKKILQISAVLLPDS